MTHRYFGCLVLTASLLTPPLPAAEPGSGSPSGTIRLPGGLTAHYDYHYDRKALRDARRAGDAIVALTESGNLLRFDLATLKLTRERFSPVPVVCLGRGENDTVLAGFEDGRIGRLDPVSLAPTEIARVPGKPQWVEAVPGAAGQGQAGKSQLVAVFGPFRKSIVQDLGSGKTYEPNHHATTFLLDRKGRLWLGADDGEWGGQCSYVDLTAGQIHSVDGPKPKGSRRGNLWPGVYGFSELRDGQVWAYGGTMHMGGTEGFICRVDRGKAESLYALDNSALLRYQGAKVKKEMEEYERRAAEAERTGRPIPEPDSKPEAEDPAEAKILPADRPHLPVTHIVEDPKTGAILVVAFSDIFRTDIHLAHWAKFHELNIGYQWGRRDAMGAYPSVCSVLPIDEPGKPLSLIFATQFDGLVGLDGGRETLHQLPGQLPIVDVDRIENTAEGPVVLHGTLDEVEFWRFRDGAWNPVSFAPPYQPLPAPGEAPEDVPSGWLETAVLVGRDGSIVSVSSTGGSSGNRTTARWRNGKAEVLGREISELNPMASFLTPDGQLWNADDHTLRRFHAGQWTFAARFPEPRVREDKHWIGVGHGLRAVNQTGPPWILLDVELKQLLRFSHGAGFKNPHLEPIALPDLTPRLEVWDAIPWTRSELILSTNRGLKVLALDGDKLTAAPINTTGRSFSRLCRDGQGRLWLAGKGLAVVTAAGKAPVPLDAVPMVGRSTLNALAADPTHPDGVIVAVSERGVVFVRVAGN